MPPCPCEQPALLRGGQARVQCAGVVFVSGGGAVGKACRRGARILLPHRGSPWGPHSVPLVSPGHGIVSCSGGVQQPQHDQRCSISGTPGQRQHPGLESGRPCWPRPGGGGLSKSQHMAPGKPISIGWVWETFTSLFSAPVILPILFLVLSTSLCEHRRRKGAQFKGAPGVRPPT